MVLLAAFDALLVRWTGQKDIVVGTDVGNRDQPDTERLIGFLLNHLVLRTDLSGEPTFRDVVRRVRETALSAYAHQELPFEKLVEAVRPERSENHTPIFQVLFVVQPVVRAALELRGLEQVSFELDCPTSKFDLSLFLVAGDEAISGDWVYRTELFDAATIRWLSEEFQALLGALLQRPDAPIEDAELPGRAGVRHAGPRPPAKSVRDARRSIVAACE
jgi:non-ribosomal peptide synthetase component F